MRSLLSISPSVFTPAYLGPRSLNIIAEQATVTRHRPTLRPLLHSRRSTVYIVVSRTLARYALPSMRFKCTLETLRNCTESSPHFFFSFFPSLSLSLSISLPLHVTTLSRLSTVLHILLNLFLLLLTLGLTFPFNIA